MRWRLLPCLFLLVGCYTTEALNERGRQVRVMSGDPPKGCQEIGLLAPGMYDCGQTYLVFYGRWATPEGMRNCLRNMSADMGGNYFRMETQRSGTVFKCPPEAVDGLVEPAAPSP